MTSSMLILSVSVDSGAVTNRIVCECGLSLFSIVIL